MDSTGLATEKQAARNCFPPLCAAGLTIRFPPDRRLPRRSRGRRSRRARTCSWSRRPARARRSPRSWRSSIGSSAHTSTGTLLPELQCVYVSPLRSLNYDIERNLRLPLEGIRERLGCEMSPVRVGVRTGDTSAYERRKLRDRPPHVLITTPESLSLLLSQPSWQIALAERRHIIVDEVHALAPTKRGADLAVSLERLAASAERDPVRVGLSATCHAGGEAARFLVGPARACRVVEAPLPRGTPPPGDQGQEPDRARRSAAPGQQLPPAAAPAAARDRAEPHDGDLRQHARVCREADVRPAARPAGRARWPAADETVAAHHSALDAARRRAVESKLRAGRLRAVVTSTSLELGVDIGTADLAVQIGLPGSVARCVQRVGRSGHRLGVGSRGLLLAATPAELAGAAVTARAALAGRVEPLRMVRAPLDVVCQQLVGMACAGEHSDDEAFAFLRKSGPMAELERADFDACLAFLAGELPGPAGAIEPEPGAIPRWTSPRIWRRDGQFGLRSRRVARWFACNVGTIHSEEMARVIDRGIAVGTVEAAYAERLVPGDRFVLDGRTFEFRRLEKSIVAGRAAPWRAEPAAVDERPPVAVGRARAGAGRVPSRSGPAAGGGEPGGAPPVADRDVSTSTRSPRRS